jgi:putative FmdB family regulatory protein
VPLYCFTCQNCGNTFERHASIQHPPLWRKCSVCGKRASRNIIAEHCDGTVDSQMREYSMDGSTGTRLYAASYLPSQIEEAKRKHPGRDFRLVNGCYLPVIRNRRDKLHYLKEHGFVEYD